MLMIKSQLVDVIFLIMLLSSLSNLSADEAYKNSFA